MILAVDVDYREARARVAGILFREWGDAQAVTELVVECEVTDDYRPGAFFRRELPCIEHLLREIRQPIDCIVVDGYVYLGMERRPALASIYLMRWDNRYRSSAWRNHPSATHRIPRQYSGVEAPAPCMSPPRGWTMT